MQATLNEIYTHTLLHFKEYLNAQANLGNSLCELEDASFKRGLPSYEDSASAYLYLMRYSAAYLSEYYLAFKEIINSRFFLWGPLSILTLGSGSNLDGLAACLAIRDSGEKRKIYYYGIEKAKWPVRVAVGKRFHNIPKNISEFDMGDLTSFSSINTISFPKILSEIETGDIIDFLGRGILNNLDSRLCLLFSNRNADNTTDWKNEIEKISHIVDYFTTSSNSYCVKRDIHLTGRDKDYKGIRLHNLQSIPFSSCPVTSEVIQVCDDPGQFCVKAKDCDKRRIICNPYSGFSTSACREKIGRYPIIKASYFDTHIYLLEKI